MKKMVCNQKTLKDKSTYCSMEQNTCGDCKTKKDLDKSTGNNITCNACLEKGRTGSTEETLTTYIIEVDM